MKKQFAFLSIFMILAMLTSLVLQTAPAQAAGVGIDQDFRHSTAPGWVFDGTATLTAPGTDPDGDGWLRLTSNAGDQAGSAIYNTAFSNTKGIQVSFLYATYGGSGADGFTFYLIDGATGSPTVGAVGGSLGYSWRSVAPVQPGVTNGYVGIGFDEYGNFVNTSYGDGGLVSGTDIAPNRIGIRGPGNLSTGFPYLTSVGMPIETGSRAGAKHVVITITPSPTQKISVTVDGVVQIDSFSMVTYTMPATFKMGFSASTGGSTNYHEIRDLTVTGLNPSTTTVATSGSPSVVGNPVTFTATVTGDATHGTPAGNVAFYDGATYLGTGALDAGGVATYTTSALTEGNHTITAKYLGDSDYAISQGTVTQSVVPPPTITNINPDIGPVAGGTTVVITGTNLSGGTVTFDGLPATCTVDSDTQITCTTPAHAVGAVDVVVTTSEGSATADDGFTYIAPLPDDWSGTGGVTSNQPIVTVGRPHIGSPAQISAYAGFGQAGNTAYLPMLFKKAFGGSYNSAFYVQNPGDSTAAFSITYYNLDGTTACIVNDSLAAGASKGYWVPGEACLSDGFVGGAVIASDNPIVVVGRPHVGSEVMSYNGLQSGGTTAHLPMLFRAAFGGSYNAAIYIQNTSASEATFSMSFYAEDGNLTCEMTAQTVAAHGIKNYWLPTQTCVPANWSGSVTITSDQHIVALARTHVGAQISTYAGFNATGVQAYVPMLFRKAFADKYASALYIQNVTGNSAAVTVSYRGNDGAETCKDTLNLSAHAAERLWLPTESCVPDGWAGGAIITSDSDENVVAVGRTHVLGTGEVASYPGHVQAFNQAFLPMLFKTAFGNYESAMYVQNVSASPADIRITFRDANGVAGCVVTETLPAYATQGYWLPNVCNP